MITLHRGAARQHTGVELPSRARRAPLDEHFAVYPPPVNGGDADPFGNLVSLREVRLRPRRASSGWQHQEGEILTYVREGTFAHEDSSGTSGEIRAGEFQLLTAGDGVRRKEFNASLADGMHAYQICVRASEPGCEPGQQQQRFGLGQRRGRLCLVASRDAREGSLRIHQDALIYSAVLESGQHLVHEVTDGRSVWLHLVDGAMTMGAVLLEAGDGAGVTAEPSVSVTARGSGELLLVDMAAVPPRALNRR
jgi:quercetin 2,3-dioxygenase